MWAIILQSSGIAVGGTPPKLFLVQSRATVPGDKLKTTSAIAYPSPRETLNPIPFGVQGQIREENMRLGIRGTICVTSRIFTGKTK